MYWPSSESIVATICCSGTPPVWIAGASWVGFSTASIMFVLLYRSITSGRLA